MKLHFEPNLDYQLQAIEAVCDLFRGQEVDQALFTVTRNALGLQHTLAYEEDALGIGNRLMLLDDQLLENLNAVQLRNGLAPSSVLSSGDFTVEMETGTGKTYVYLRTIFELNRRYGFNKFVIVVPSVAIREGVYKSLQITETHLRSLYANAPYEYFMYDSSKLGQVRNFATSPKIQIMVVTVGAINKKDVNNLYKNSEKTNDYAPIHLIKSTRPIVIVDEPQSVDGGLSGSGKKALDAMNPLCTLRYSATHADKHHMVYRLDAVDAYERKLVKQIEVASATIQTAHNKPYVKLLSVSNKRGDIKAKAELDVQRPNGVRRVPMYLHAGDHLEMQTGRAVYEDMTVGEIRVEKGHEFMELRYPGGETFLELGGTYGDVDHSGLQRLMIRRTIQEHLDKEKRLRPKGIKVLSLFFIDRVENYRKYDEDGQPVKGEYAHLFEEEYARWARHPDYRDLFGEVDLTREAQEVHDGYFSIDKKGGWTDTEENNQTNRDNAERAYNLIMKDKEKLLSMDTPLKFIFSHSALREGWDNPNVFQICALREMGSETQRRQTIGRGLRLCVNQDGERVRGFEVNTLTVVATEGYEQFAENLQHEIEQETGIRFGIIEKHQFAAVTVVDEAGGMRALGVDSSEKLWEELRAQKYIDSAGRVQDALRTAIKDEKLVLPEEFEDHREQVTEILRKACGRLEVKDADERKQIAVRREVLDSPEFKALWDRIKHKTTYRVQFNNEKLIKDCIDEIHNKLTIPKTHLVWRRADIAIGRGGVGVKELQGSDVVMLEEGDIVLPDVVTELQDRTQLTRRTIVRILTESKRLNDFRRNPQEYIDQVADIINRRKRLALVDGIKYQPLGDGHYYAQELFQEEELTGYIRNLIEAERSVYEHIICDSGTERTFAEELHKNRAIKVYVKLPGWFKVPTPLGSYNPDWAVVVERDGVDHLYFVVETKSTLLTDELRSAETGKITCGEAHFRALETGDNPAEFIKARTAADVLLHKA